MVAYKCTSRGEKEMRKRIGGKGLAFATFIWEIKRIKWKKSFYEGRLFVCFVCFVLFVMLRFPKYEHLLWHSWYWWKPWVLRWVGVHWYSFIMLYGPWWRIYSILNNFFTANLFKSRIKEIWRIWVSSWNYWKALSEKDLMKVIWIF
jgi:hypothetical protein